MTGRDKILAALSPQGTPEIGVVLCYTGIFIRDHWSALTDQPWWAQHSPDLELQLAWRRDVIERTGQDWLPLPGRFWSHDQRQHLAIEPRADGVYRVDQRSGKAERLEPPQVGGSLLSTDGPSDEIRALAATREGLERLIPEPARLDQEALRSSGELDLAAALRDEWGGQLYLLSHIGTAFDACVGWWGFDELMVKVAMEPELVHHASERVLAQRVAQARLARLLGADGVWLEDCYSNLVSRRSAAVLHLPYLQRLVTALRAEGLHTILYYCGDPSDRWDLLLDAGADALSLEESKKGFRIDLDEVVDEVAGRCALLGNLDAVGVLQDAGDEGLRRAIERQLAAGRRHGGRFVMSLGSPVTPGTSVERVRRYCDLVRDVSREP